MCFSKSGLSFSVRAACTCAVARTGIIDIHVILVHIKCFKGVILIIICSNCAAAQCPLMQGAKAEWLGTCCPLVQGRKTQLLNVYRSLVVRAKVQLMRCFLVQKAKV